VKRIDAAFQPLQVIDQGAMNGVANILIAQDIVRKKQEVPA